MMHIRELWKTGLPLLLQVIFSKAQLLLDRTVNCQSNAMRVTLNFAQPFAGIVYADKFYQSRECRWEGDGSRSLVAPVPLNTNPANQPYCGVEVRDASGEFSVTLVISPIRNLLVDGMEGLTVRCLYNTGDVTLTLPAGANGAGLFISPQTQAGVVTGSGGSPFLQMTIRDGHGINGDVVQSAQVGQRITLDVVMQDTTIYDFWVHDCYAHDGTNSPEASISIIDANGCAVRLARAVDPPVFETSPVPNGAKHVYVLMYGFQFTTSQLVYFECQVRPCLQSCNRPQCRANDDPLDVGFLHSPRNKRQLTDESSTQLSTTEEEDPDNYNLTAVIRIQSQEIQAIAPVARDDPISKNSTKAKLCIHANVAVAILVIFILVCCVSLFIAIYMCHRARKDSKSLLPTPRSVLYSHSSPTHSRRSPSGSSPSPQPPIRFFGRSEGSWR